MDGWMGGWVDAEHDNSQHYQRLLDSINDTPSFAAKIRSYLQWKASVQLLR
jgi:hypothetical protein